MEGHERPRVHDSVLDQSSSHNPEASLKGECNGHWTFVIMENRHGGYLAKLATRFGSDKWGSHWYADHYERHFKPLRWKRLKLLEIGIGGDSDPEGGGGSLRAWKRFFPRAEIAGIDLYDKRVHEGRRIRTFKGDQSDEEFLHRVIHNIGRPDIVIDDGSHINHHVITSFKILFPLLKLGGIYAVEDTQTSYWPKYGGQIGTLNRSDDPTIMGFFKALADGLNHAEFLDSEYAPSYWDRHVVSVHFYHNLLFVYKGLNDEGSNCVEAGQLRC